MIDNIHKVPVKLWKSFKSNHAREIFNVVFARSAKNQNIIAPPKMKKLTQEQWTCICHNIACMAAWAIERQPLVPGDIVKTNKKSKKENVD